MSGPNPPENEGSDLDRPEPGAAAPDTSETEFYSRAYSAPESEQFTSGPYVPADASLYDYDSYQQPEEPVEQPAPPRWPWVVGVVAIIAAIALVASVSVLVTRTDTDSLATPETSTTTVPPVQDAITTTPPPPPPPPPPTSEEPPPPPPETVTVTQEPPPSPTEAPPPPPPPETTSAPPPPPPTTTRAGPRQVTYSVTGTKAPGDIITVTYIDASGRSRTQRNVYIPWSLTVTPISQSEVGSVQASSLFLVSRLNCSITTSDGTVLSSNTNNSAQTSC
jgi:Mycobacterium membrane protein